MSFYWFYRVAAQMDPDYFEIHMLQVLFSFSCNLKSGSLPMMFIQYCSIYYASTWSQFMFFNEHEGRETHEFSAIQIKVFYTFFTECAKSKSVLEATNKWRNMDVRKDLRSTPSQGLKSLGKSGTRALFHGKMEQRTKIEGNRGKKCWKNRA